MGDSWLETDGAVPELPGERGDDLRLGCELQVEQRLSQLASPLALVSERRVELRLVDDAGLEQKLAESPLRLHGAPPGTPSAGRRRPHRSVLRSESKPQKACAKSATISPHRR